MDGTTPNTAMEVAMYLPPLLRKFRENIRESRRRKARSRENELASRFGPPEVDLEAVTGSASYRVEPVIYDDICLFPYKRDTERDTAVHDDYGALMRVLDAIQPKTLLELGTAHGNTIANICKRFPEVRIITVDAPKAILTGSAVTFALREDEIGRVYKKHVGYQRVTQLFQNTLRLDLAGVLSPASVDVAIIDACHDTDYVINDFHKVRPFVRRNGIVLFHDTHPSMEGHLRGSFIACSMLRKSGLDIRHIRDTWWGIWVNRPPANSPTKLMVGSGSSSS